MTVVEPVKGILGKSFKEEAGIKVGLREQAAITLAEMAKDDRDMQGAIIRAGGVPPLLTIIRLGSQLGQEHAARAIKNLAAYTEMQMQLVDCRAIPELVQLLRVGSPFAQEMAAAGLADIAYGCVVERQSRAAAGGNTALANGGTEIGGASTTAQLAKQDGAEGEEDGVGDQANKANDRLLLITEAGGIVPLVALLTSGTAPARENAAAALWHLALETSNQGVISKANGIQQLVTVLDDATDKAYEHAANALARLSILNPDNQLQVAKHCVALLANQNDGAQKRASDVLKELARVELGAPVVVVNAGAISPLVALLTSSSSEVKQSAADALSMLSFKGPSTQLAIASGLVMLIGQGSANSQEQATQLLLHLSHDPVNCRAVARAGAVPRLVMQMKGGGRTSVRAQELAVAVLSNLSALEECVAAIMQSSGLKALVGMLSSASYASAHAASVIAAIARSSVRNKRQVISEGGIVPLVNLLSKEQRPKAKAESAGALQALAAEQPQTQKWIAEAGALKPLILLLSESEEHCLIRACGAIAALCKENIENGDAVRTIQSGISKLVNVLNAPMAGEVHAKAAAALAVLADSNARNQDEIAAVGGILPLVALLGREGQNDTTMAESSEQGVHQTTDDQTSAAHATEEAAAALWTLASLHSANQIAIAEADGIAKLVSVLGVGSERAQDQAAGALAALALGNTSNENSIAELIVGLLGSTDNRDATSKAARAIAKLARANASNQRSIASAGGLELLVSLLAEPSPPSVVSNDAVSPEVQTVTAPETTADVTACDGLTVHGEIKTHAALAENIVDDAEKTEPEDAVPPEVARMLAARWLAGTRELLVQKAVADALWSMASASEPNQVTVAQAGGISRLIGLLNGHPSSHREAAGALWALASHPGNQVRIAQEGGIAPLVALLKVVKPKLPITAEDEQDASSETANDVKKRRESRESVEADMEGTQKDMMTDLGASETAAGALSMIALTRENRDIIARARGIEPLIALFDGGSESATEQASLAL